MGAIREMVPRLEADGLVHTVPQRGMQVAQVDINLIRNAFQFRLIVEREAAAAFAQAAPVSYTHLRAHETVLDLVCRLLLEQKITRDILVDSTHTR